jgi:hypothetical protein
LTNGFKVTENQNFPKYRDITAEVVYYGYENVIDKYYLVFGKEKESFVTIK